MVGFAILSAHKTPEPSRLYAAALNVDVDASRPQRNSTSR